MLCNPAGKKATYDRDVAIRKKVNENRYSLKWMLPAQETNTYYVEFVGTYDDVKKRYEKAIQNLREGKWEWSDTVGLADQYFFDSWAESSCTDNWCIKDGFNRRIKKVKKDYKP